ncbi:Methionyl-tRNA formyltransferase [Zhongshania aliphaticivorans]|uniref:Methionyl-tRNA formyltransferase n=1 Tax=Zhongshania aliphaticivorans TaxID=1470434 RepID=A0A5S9PLI4_9GAMM|nr:methionyl-tRNA formyltransferase [Zhongshania aliphaticivorans]CAA0104552.1 Methionyl-tRNA formyltransferase [Zhongshania aliphaticivorans]CAA0104806.1 Methionyl-tRNA formyltransferase [Zhongshania aliphaticivorans]
MKPTPLRLIFAGTPDFAAQHLQALIDDGSHDIVAVYSQPDRPAGRGKKTLPSAVKHTAEVAGLPVYQPINFKDIADQELLASHNADLMIVVAYGLLLPQRVLDIPRLGCINVHGSLLPRWRGAAPIQRAIEAGDSETGITIMQMDAGLDTGDMISKVNCAIKTTDSAADLFKRLADIGGPALIQAVNALAAGQATAQPQDDSLSNYASKIAKPEAIIDWQQDAVSLGRKIRAFNPFPICYTRFAANPKDERIKIWRAEPLDISHDNANPGEILSADKTGITVACGQGVLRILDLQMPGGKVLAAGDVLNAKADLFSPSTLLGSPSNTP